VTEIEMAIEKLKRHKSPGIDKFQQNWLKQEVGQFVLRSINLLILFGIKRNCLSSGRSRSLYLFIRRVIKQIAVIIEAYHFCCSMELVSSLPEKDQAQVADGPTLCGRWLGRGCMFYFVGQSAIAVPVPVTRS
jgi:hypothetical protein